jgi:hypothetical protein
MSGDERRPDPQDGEEPSAEESLDEALSHLERMLEHRGGADASPGRPEVGVEEPLLDEVVIPTATMPFAEEPQDGPEVDRNAIESADLSRRVAQRLASEIEIIVSDRIEQAIEQALAQAQQRIRDHLAIVLPEIVDELRQSPHDDE